MFACGPSLGSTFAHIAECGRRVKYVIAPRVGARRRPAPTMISSKTGDRGANRRESQQGIAALEAACYPDGVQLLPTALLVVLAAAGCARTPYTHRSQLILVSAEEESRLG